MKFKRTLVLRKLAKEYIWVPVGRETLTMNGLYTVTPSAALTVEGIQNDKSREEILDDIVAKFNIDRETAETDLDIFLNELKANDFI